MFHVTGISLQMRKVIKLKSIHQCICLRHNYCAASHNAVAFSSRMKYHYFFQKNGELQVCNRIFETTVVLVKAETFVSDFCFFIPEGINLSLKLKTLKFKGQRDSIMKLCPS